MTAPRRERRVGSADPGPDGRGPRRSSSLLSSVVATLAAVIAVSATAGPAAAVRYPDGVPPAAVVPTDAPVWVVLVRGGDAAIDEVLAEYDVAEIVYRYRTLVSGFAARLGPETADALRQDPRVLHAQPDGRDRLAAVPPAVRREPSAALRPDPTQPVAHRGAGAGTVIGVIDTGIWPETPAFAPLPLVSRRAANFDAPCVEGSARTLPWASEEWDAQACNGKILTGRSFFDGFGASAISARETLAPRDMTGHGTQVAALAAGSPTPVGDPRHGGRRLVAGTAPSAALAVYKACWAAPDPADDGCATSDVVAAFDQAVSDGVDVIVYAATGHGDRDAVARAVRAARSAGVAVVVPAGNAGPAATSVRDHSPWALTVGAARTVRRWGTLTLPDGRLLPGATSSARMPGPAPLVAGADAAADPQRRADAAQCLPGSLDPGRVRGSIVLCDRGIGARVEKSATVAAAGGVGMVLANTHRQGTIDTTFADVHAVPTLHLARADARVVRRAARTDPGGPVTLKPGDQVVQPPVQALFSARGRLARGAIKPDVLAPGVDLLTPTSAATGRPWVVASGTSLAAGHVAGVVAAVRADHPTWTVDEVVAVVTGTATPLRPGVPGVVVPGAARNAAVSVTSRRGSPAVVVDGLRRPAELRRVVRNLGARTQTLTVRQQGLGGFEVEVLPRSVTLAPGERRVLRLRIAAAPGVTAWSRGSLTWVGSLGSARVLVALRGTDSGAAVPRPPR